MADQWRAVDPRERDRQLPQHLGGRAGGARDPSGDGRLNGAGGAAAPGRPPWAALAATDADYRAVNALQAQYKLIPLSAFGKPFTYEAPPVDPNPGFSMTDKPQQVIDALDTPAYFSMMARLMGSSAPPAPEDAPMVAKLARIGLEPGKPFDMGKLDPAVQAALKDIGKVAQKEIFAQQSTSGTKQNGWLIPAAAGAYGTDYLQRALIAAFGWPANLPEDAVYPYALVDGAGEKLTGANRYTLTFAKGETPPVDGFWSITMYFDDGGWWFVPNPLNRFTVSMRDRPKLLAQVQAQTGAALPRFVQDEFDAYLQCGILAHGFLRLRCATCAHEKLVAFSCKGRGFCPSCGARRMAQTAAHLVDAVIPQVPVRQWVLSFPIPLRVLLAAHPQLISASLEFRVGNLSPR